jgi:hypothetical protein
MKIAVYQINPERDVNGVRFEGLEMTEQLQGIARIDTAIYDEVYSGEINAATLDDVFVKLNVFRPTGFNGHSLSVSDIIKTDDGYFFVDSVGFEKVDFEANE